MAGHPGADCGTGRGYGASDDCPTAAAIEFRRTAHYERSPEGEGQRPEYLRGHAGTLGIGIHQAPLGAGTCRDRQAEAKALCF